MLNNAITAPVNEETKSLHLNSQGSGNWRPLLFKTFISNLKKRNNENLARAFETVLSKII